MKTLVITDNLEAYNAMTKAKEDAFLVESTFEAILCLPHLLGEDEPFIFEPILLDEILEAIGKDRTIELQVVTQVTPRDEPGNTAEDWRTFDTFLANTLIELGVTNGNIYGMFPTIRAETIQ